MLVGLTANIGAVAVPESAMECGLLLVLSARARVADSAPVFEGANVRLIVVLAPGATVIGSAAELEANSAAFGPWIVTLERTRFAVPLFVTVNATGVLVVPLF